MTTPPDTTSNTKITTATVMINPEMASRLLNTTIRNRPVSSTVVRRYRQDMEAGRWTFTGEPIQFDIEGSLINGQHRLTALSQCEPDTVLPFIVVRGLPREAQLSMDQGRKRTPGQQLALLGMKDSNNIAAGVKQYIIWSSGLLFQDNVNQQLITAPQITEWIEDNGDSVEFVHGLLGDLKAIEAPPSVTLAAALAFESLDRNATEEFYHALSSRLGFYEGNPLHTLDTRLRRLRRENVRLPNRDILSFIVLAWNAWRSGKSMTKFQRPRGGKWTANSFPEPR